MKMAFFEEKEVSLFLKKYQEEPFEDPRLVQICAELQELKALEEDEYLPVYYVEDSQGRIIDTPANDYISSPEPEWLAIDIINGPQETVSNEEASSLMGFFSKEISPIETVNLDKIPSLDSSRNIWESPIPYVDPVWTIEEDEQPKEEREPSYALVYKHDDIAQLSIVIKENFEEMKNGSNPFEKIILDLHIITLKNLFSFYKIPPKELSIEEIQDSRIKDFNYFKSELYKISSYISNCKDHSDVLEENVSEFCFASVFGLLDMLLEGIE